MHVILGLFLHENQVQKLADIFPGTEWGTCNEMRWHGDAGWLAAGLGDE